MSESPSIVDLAIIGGGPTGLFGAYYAGLRQMSVKIIDSLEVLGGQLATLYPEKYIYDVAGFPKVLAKDLAANLVTQASYYHPTLCLGEQVRELRVRTVEALELQGTRPIFTITTSKATHDTRAILIAAGMGSFQPKTLNLPEAVQYEGHGLHYFVKDVETLHNRRVLIVGGGDGAIDWANMLSPIAAEVILIHRRDQFRAHEDAVRQMLASPVRVILFHELKAISGDGRVQRAIIYDNRSKSEQSIDVDHILVNIGFNNSLGAIKDWNLELEGNAIKVDGMMRTSRPGVFAAGDVVTYPGKLKLIATGFAEACTAVDFAKTWLDPAARAFPGHSSEMKR